MESAFDEKEKLDRYLGCLVGLTVGEALVATLEFKAPGSFKPITDIVGGGPFGLKPGQGKQGDAVNLLTSVVVKLVELAFYVMHSSRGYRRIGDRHSRRKDCFSFPPGSVQPDSEFIGWY